MFKKLTGLSLVALTVTTAYAGVETFFTDVSTDDPDFPVIARYYQEGVFQGIATEDGKSVAALESAISKQNAALFLAKVMGIKNPTVEDIVEAGILSTPPASDQLLDHATWIKMLSNAFKVPTTESIDPELWYAGAYMIAQSIGAVTDETPFTPASRRFVLRTTAQYQDLFDARNADRKMDDQELNLMKMRDGLVNPDMTNDEIEKILWGNILAAEEIPDTERINAIRHLNMAVLSILELRKDPNSGKKEIYQMRASYFLKKSVEVLPDVAGFAADLEAVMMGY